MTKDDVVWSCYYCVSHVPTKDIREWTDNGKTPICPKCGVDALLQGRYQLGHMQEMHDLYFGAADDED